ncbi:MAG: PHP domain-containing protein [Phycisphaerae bacterium]
MRPLINPFEIPGKWYKANFHTHTTTSDGQVTVQERVAQYRRAGYGVLAITDHNATNDVAGMSDRKMLVISGIEYHPLSPTPYRYHLVGLNVPHGFAFADADNAVACIAEVRKAGGESILAHPSWTGQAFEDFRGLPLEDGLIAMEVYNATCDRHGRASSESEWAIALDHGWVLPIVGTDDAHCAGTDDVCECWTWLRMPALDVPHVLEAIRTGACYASCGPKISFFGVKDGKVSIRCSPAAKINFSGTPGCGRRRRVDAPKTITSFAMDLADVAKWTYMRAVVTDHAGRRAWTNPIFLK